MPNDTPETAAVVWVEAWEPTDGTYTVYSQAPGPGNAPDDGRFPVPADVWARYGAAQDACDDAREAVKMCAFNHRRAGAEQRAERARAESAQALRAAGYTVTEPGA